MALRIDTRIRQRQAEAAGKPVTTMETSTSTGHATSDPNAMDIDAAKTTPANGKKNIGDWNKSIAGKCSKCGSTDHKAKDGNHERDICNWCLKVGHRSTACMSKFFGNPRAPRQPVQKIAANQSSSSSSSLALSSGSSSASTPSQTAAASMIKVWTKDEFEKELGEMRKEVEAMKAAFV